MARVDEAYAVIFDSKGSNWFALDEEEVLYWIEQYKMKGQKLYIYVRQDVSRWTGEQQSKGS